MWRDSRWSVLTLLLAVTLVVAACSSSDESADTDPVTSAQCAESDPDCDDTVAADDSSLPPNPSGSGDVVIEGAVSVGEALAYMGDDPIAVEGYVIIDAEGPRICESIAESFPPQCGGAHLDVTNPEALTDLPLIEEGATQWTETYVTLSGDVNENEFTVTATSF